MQLKGNYGHIARMTLEGFNSRDIAGKLGMSEHSVTKIKKSPIFKQALASLQAQADDASFSVVREMKTYAKQCCDELAKMLNNPALTPNEKRGVINDILRLAGEDNRKPLIQVNTQNNTSSVKLTFEQRIRELEKAEETEVIDAQPDVDSEELLESQSELLPMLAKESMN